MHLLRPARPDRLRSTLLRRVAIVGLLASVAGGLGVAPVQAGGGGTASMLQVRARAGIAGLPSTWRLELSASKGGPSVTIGMSLQTRNPAGTATAEQDWAVQQGSVTCTATFTTCTIDDGGAFGTYGRTKLTFSPRRPVRGHDLTCAGSDVVYAKSVSRRGVLTGTLRLATGTKVSGVIRNGTRGHHVPAAIPATVSRTTYTGVSCPAGPSTCLETVGFSTTDLHASTFRPMPTGPMRFSIYREPVSAVPAVTRTEWVWIDDPKGAHLAMTTKATLAAGTVDLSAGAPFLSGDVSFLANGAKVAGTQLGCADEERPGTIGLVLTMRIPGRAKVTYDQIVPGTAFHVLP
ncbi:MAG: hypothetical protein U0869_18325 [Chloroflexota bacterium]